MRMRKREMRPCHLGRTASVDAVVVGAGSNAFGAGVQVAGAVLVDEKPELEKGLRVTCGAGRRG